MFHEADSYGSKFGNGTWNGMVELVRSGIAHVGVGDFAVTKERSEVVAHTDTLRFVR
jgi:hypothetical protein